MEGTIRFSKEEEQDGILPFLDVTVINNKPILEFDVYRKPTFTGRLITSDSFHNYSHKMAAIHSMAHRLVSLPLNQSRYELERKRILEIGLINGYPNSTVNNIISKHELKRRRVESSILFESTKEIDKKRIVLPYLGDYNRHFSRMYRDVGFKMVNKNEYNLQKLIGGAKDKIPKLLKSGIYKVGCQVGCLFKYIGKSERNPTIRFEEHDQCVTKNDLRSAVARHMIEYKHATDISNLELVQPVSSRNTVVFECYEKIHILKNKGRVPLMNQNDGNVNSILFDLVGC